MTHFALFQYYGIDWIAMIMMFSSVYFLGLKKRTGFAFGGVASVCWIIFGTMVGSIADIAANVMCLGMNLVGFIRWSRSER